MKKRDFDDLLQSVRDIKAHMRGEAVPGARVTHLEKPEPAEIRERLGLSQGEFATLLGISVRTLQEWEQGRRDPSGPALQLLRVVAKHPEAVLDAVRPA